MLNDGHVAEIGTHDELLAHNGVYSGLLASQLDKTNPDGGLR